MHRFTKAALGAALVSAGALVPASAQAASATANAKANILKPVTVSKSTDLDFGNVLTSPAAGTAVMTQAGARSCTGGATCVNGGTPGAGTFSVTGTINQTVAISLPSATVSLTSGTNSMSVALSAPTTLGLGATGTASFGVGGTLTVGLNQADGAYTGTFSVNVDYQ